MVYLDINNASTARCFVTITRTHQLHHSVIAVLSSFFLTVNNALINFGIAEIEFKYLFDICDLVPFSVSTNGISRAVFIVNHF